jgi:hypothetical protein
MAQLPIYSPALRFHIDLGYNHPDPIGFIKSQPARIQLNYA